jgi:hypothetical protein
MRSKLYSIAGIGFFSVCMYLAFELSKSEAEADFLQVTESHEGAGADKPLSASEFEANRTRDPITRKVHRERLDKAREIQLQSFAEQERTGIFTPISGVNFAERGPNNVGGRTRALMYDLNDPAGMKVWAGGVGGGLWWTNNITATPTVWNKVSDTLNRLSVTCITQSRSFATRNKMFFGTGEGWSNIDAIRGNGIWRSMDGGATWTHLLTTKNNPNFSNVLDILYVDNMGGPCSPGDISVLAATDSGVFKSINDGDSWTKVLGKGIAGATINPAADLEAEYYWTYASLGKVDIGGGGIWRSCDAGATWERIYAAAADEERIEIAAHYLDGWEMYALVQGDRTHNLGIKKIMRTSNADDPNPNSVSWPTKPLPFWCSRGVGSGEFTRGQAWYDLALAIAPIFRNPPANTHTWTAYIGGVDLFKTTDNGASFNQISQWVTGCARPMVHADIHTIVFKPDPVNAQFFPDEFLVATDGGIYRSTDGGASFTSRNNSYNVTQFYSCAIHPTLPNYFLAGAQDNGSQKFTSAGINATTNIIADDHDGGYCFIDEDNPSIQIATYIENNFFISTDGGANFSFEAVNDEGQFINAMDYDDNSDILYSGHQPGRYFRFENPALDGPKVEVTVPEFGSDSVTFVVLSPSVTNRVYFGLGNGAIVRVDGANTGNAKPGTVIRSDLGAFHTVSCIAIDPANEDHMLVTYSNYGVTSVYESSPGTGGSLTWTSLDGNGTLPDMPVRWAMFDPRNADWAILATELGIWSSNNLDGVNTNWSATNNNIANTRVDMLRYRASDRLLAAATHGRGLFTATIPTGIVPVTLLNFKGTIVGNDALLEWTTANEQNSQQFNIERSDDGIRFRTAGVVGAAGNTTTNRSYHFHDKEIAQEKNYYRLKQLDLDGTFEYSKIVLLRKPLAGKEPFKLLTNPFDQTIDLQLGNINKGRANFRLFDMNGKLVLNSNHEVTPSMRLRLQIPSATIASGVYTLEMIINGSRYSAKLVRR